MYVCIYIYICTHTITININITITIRPTGGVCILRMVGIAESGGGGGVDGHDCFWLGADLRDSGSGCVCVCAYISLSLSLLYCTVLYCIVYCILYIVHVRGAPRSLAVRPSGPILLLRQCSHM